MKKILIQFLVISILLILETELLKIIIKYDQLIYNSLSEKLTSEQIHGFFEIQDKWKWISYVFVPIYILLKTSTIATILYVGGFFFSHVKITFKQLWSAVITAEFVFLLIPLLKIVWFYFFETTYKLEDVQYFMPLSALNIIGYQGLEAWYIYPLQTLNLFEVAYWLVLAFYLGKATQTNIDNGLKIVAFSYGAALLLWVVIIMFVTLNYS